MDLISISKAFLSFFNTYAIAGISFIFYIFSKDEDKYKPLIALLFLTMMYNSIFKEIFKLPLPDTCHADCYSFPSGHMNFSSIFYIWMIIKNKNKFVRFFLISIWILSGSAMVFAGYHHARDIIITPAFSISFILLYRYLEAKLRKQNLEFMILSFAFFMIFINCFMVGKMQYHISLAFQIIFGVYIMSAILSNSKQNSLKKVGYFVYSAVFIAILINQYPEFFKILCELKFLYISSIVVLLRSFKEALFRKKLL